MWDFGHPLHLKALSLLGKCNMQEMKERELEFNRIDMYSGKDMPRVSV